MQLREGENMKKYKIVDSVDTFNEAFARVKAAEEKYATYTQEQVDKIFTAAAIAAKHIHQKEVPL